MKDPSFDFIRAVRRLPDARAGGVDAHARSVSSRCRRGSPTSRAPRVCRLPADITSTAAARVCLSPEGPRSRAVVHPAQYFRDSDVLSISGWRGRRYRAIRASASRRRAVADAARGAHGRRSRAAARRRHSMIRSCSATAPCSSSRTAPAFACPSGSRIGVQDLLLDDGSCACSARVARSGSSRSAARAIGAVAMYLRELRPRLERGEGKGALFLNARGKPLSRMGAWKILRRYVELAGHRRSTSARTRCGTPSPRTCSRAARTCGRCRRCSATPTSRRRRSTPTSTASTCEGAQAVSIREAESPSPRPIACSPRAIMILVIDNYDSFTYNLVQYLGELGADVDRAAQRRDYRRRDRELQPRRSCCLRAPVRRRKPESPSTSFAAGADDSDARCLPGHQAIGEAYGGDVVRADRVMHGKTSQSVTTEPACSPDCRRRCRSCAITR